MEYPSPAGRRPGAFSPMPTNATPHLQARALHQRSHSSGSDSSTSSQLTAMSGGRRTPYQQGRPTIYASANSSSTSLHNQHLSIAGVVNDAPSRKNSPLNPTTTSDSRSHKRNNSQGFFEPSLPSASLVESGMSGLTASQIAAQAAMLQQNANNSHSRKRSQTVPSPMTSPEANNGRPKPPPLPTVQPSSARRPPDGRLPTQYQNLTVPSPAVAATSAANAAYPRSAQLSPGLTSFSELPAEKEREKEKEGKGKTERSKMKLFSKPKHIGIPGYKDMDRKDKPLPSPGKVASPGPSLLSNKFNASTTSLVDSATPASSGGASIYSMANSSTSTLVPRSEDKEKSHRHNFLSRQKNKLKDKMDDHTLTLSSASSNSKPIDPSAPQSIYNFAPSSPGLAQSSFSKSVSGFDLRHGGRALREKRREEKAAMPDAKKGEVSGDWLAATGLTPSGATNAANNSLGLNFDHSYGNLQGFGLSNMTAEDAWDFLKAKILIIFEGEELRMPVEDLNRLVSIHIQRSFQKRAPTTMTEDVDDLLRTGFLSLDQTLRNIPDEKLVPHLVEMWLFVFGVVLPYIQAVFLPLDLEFKGQGTIIRDPAEFWGVQPDLSLDGGLENELDVRRLVLLSYRDNIILPRHDTLKAIFSRLSLESINVVGLESPQPPHSPSGGRPGTGSSGASTNHVSTSYNSQSSTLLGGDSGARSRATSNTSNAELPSFSPPLRRQLNTTTSFSTGGQGTNSQQGAEVTETVGRMLQCMSVLASLRSGDEAQETIEEITKALKLNWLGRGRTGRNRKGFVGARTVRIKRL